MKKKGGGDGNRPEGPRITESPAGGNGSGGGEFDAFLSGLAAVVAERVRELGAKPGALADPVFFDETKSVLEWPELSAYVIEELR